MKEEKPSGNLSRLRNELGRRLTVMRYSKVTTKKHMKVFGWAEDYLYGYGETNYTKELGQRFLIEYPLQTIHSPTLFNEARITIRRIDEILENNLFAPRLCKANSECPPRFTGLYDKYIESLAKRGYKERTIVNCKAYAGRLRLSVLRTGSRLPETVLSPEELSAADLYEVFTKHEWPLTSLPTARSFLSFLFENGETKTNLSACVPGPARPKPLPSVYSGGEVKRLLSSVDRAGSLGKRDYAILVLAACLGLRSSDVAGLSFKDADRTAKTIEIIQIKTGRPLKLVMNREVEEAVADYIENGRPRINDAPPPRGPSAGSSEKIFLCFRAPFSPLKAGPCYAIANKYFRLAGIAAQGRKRGAHALRASYATALVAKGVPYAAVQEALGHKDPESAKYYVRVDARRLRTCALDVPKPSGAFAVMLGDLEGAL